MGPCQFISYSFDVMFEGQNVCRLGDMLTHNGRNAVGQSPAPELPRGAVAATRPRRAVGGQQRCGPGTH
jgi:hypothetical protein